MDSSANITSDNAELREPFYLEGEGQTLTIRAFGLWTLKTVKAIDPAIREALSKRDYTDVAFDLSHIERLDTSGAYILTRAVRDRQGETHGWSILAGSPSHVTLLETAVEASAGVAPRETRQWYDMLTRMGQSLENVMRETVDTIAFLGKFFSVFARSIFVPGKIRWKSVFAQTEQIGVDAMPIVAVLSFFIGAVIAYMGAELLANFNASVMSARMVGFIVLREFAVLITVILLAGRSDSAFTAQIGAMKMRQEIDAMKVMGLDTYEALVIPRTIACLISAPILTFIAMMTGLLGGMLVSWSLGNGVTPQLFWAEITNNVGINNFWVGMIKAPVFALVIAIIGCRQGLAVDGSVTSLGNRTTSSVVQAIFAVILLDAVFALMFLKLGY